MLLTLLPFRARGATLKVGGGGGGDSPLRCVPRQADWTTTAHHIPGARLNLEPMFICLGTVAVFLRG